MLSGWTIRRMRRPGPLPFPTAGAQPESEQCKPEHAPPLQQYKASNETCLFLRLVADDSQEALGFQARSAYQSAINIRLPHQIADVFRFDASAVQNPNLLGRFVAELLGEPVANGTMRFLGCLRRGRTPGTDCPDRFVGENDT